MSNSLNAVINDILEEGLVDWVPIDRVIGVARDLSFTGGVDFHTVASDLVLRLIEGKLMRPGSIGSRGFEGWSGSPEALTQQVIAECKSFDWQPQGAGCWLANTDEGDRVARETRQS